MNAHTQNLFTAALLFVIGDALAAGTPVVQKKTLEEVIVTAEKHEASLQTTPIAISVLNREQLEVLGVTGLGSFDDGKISSFRVMPFANTPSTKVLSIRGNGPNDVGPITREGSVAIYIDGFYLGRGQGLSAEVADLQRIEVLRGPQGTLFGRNANGGAVNLITRDPSGKFGFEQSLSGGSYDYRRSATRLDLPEMGGLSVKLDYLHSQRDGWVKNSAPGQADYNQYKSDGGRVTLNWQLSDEFRAKYAYDNSRIAATQNYFQLYRDDIGLIGVERDRETHTRFPVTPLEPSVTHQQGHSLTLQWDLADRLTLKSLTGYRTLTEATRNNFAGALYNNGYIAHVDVKQSQLSQEVQLVGQLDRLDYVAGLFGYRENAHEAFQNLYSLDEFGFITGVPLTPIPASPLNPLTGLNDPLRNVSADSQSLAAYSQATWTAPILDNKLKITVGGRYTQDKKYAIRHLAGVDTRSRLDTDHFDYTLTADYQWIENLSTYLKHSTAYQAGGVNPRSGSFRAFDNNTVASTELGIKSESWDKRLRINADTFHSVYHHVPIEYATADISLTETINARRDVRVNGAELDVSVVPLPGLVLSANYTYLDGDMPLQPNPLEGNTLQEFALTQTPRHAGAAAIDYTFAPWEFGTLTAHIDVSSTSPYAYVQTDLERRDAYTLVNGRLTLTDIPVSSHGEFKASVWGKNLTDERYVVMGFPVGAVAFTQAFGDPRTYGVDLTYRY